MGRGRGRWAGLGTLTLWVASSALAAALAGAPRRPEVPALPLEGVGLGQLAPRPFTPAQGLAGTTTTSLAVLPDGTLIAGGFEGLSVFRDGVWQALRPPPERAARSVLTGGVVSLLVDGRGWLWAGGLLGGVAALPPGPLEARRFLEISPAELGEGPVWALAEFDGAICAGTSRGLRLIDPTTRAVRPPGDADLAELPVRSLAAEGQRLWVGTRAGLFRVANGVVTARESTGTGLPANQISALAVQGPHLWVGTPRGLAVRQEGRWRVYNRADGLPADAVNALLPLRDGGVVVGTSGGLARIQADGTAGETVREEQGLLNNDVQSLARVGETLWVGSYYGGVTAFDRRLVNVLRRVHGLSSDIVHGFAPAPGDGVFVATQRGLDLARRGRAEPVRPETFAGQRVRDLLPGREGGLWVATYGGLFWLPPDLAGAPRRWGVAEGLPTDFVRTVALGPAGTLWVGTAAGLARLVNGVVEPVPGEEGLLGDQVLGLTVDRAGVLWVSTASRGLWKFDAGELRPYAGNQALPRGAVFRLTDLGPAGRWVGTTAGVARVDGPAPDLLSDLDGERLGSVFQIIEGDPGDLFLTTARGLYLVRGARLDSAGEGAAVLAAGAVYVLGRQEGLPGDDLVANSRTLFVRRPDGGAELWAASSQGVGVLDPALLPAPAADRPAVVVAQPANLPATVPAPPPWSGWVAAGLVAVLLLPLGWRGRRR